MVAIHRKPVWAISEALATPEQAVLDRRTILKAWGLGGLAATTCAVLPRSARAEIERKPAGNPALYPAKRNEAYELGRSLTPEEINSKYNNFYEFGLDKSDPAANAHTLRPHPWTLRVEGEVRKPLEIDIDQLSRVDESQLHLNPRSQSSTGRPLAGRHVWRRGGPGPAGGV